MSQKSKNPLWDWEWFAINAPMLLVCQVGWVRSFKDDREKELKETYWSDKTLMWSVSKYLRIIGKIKSYVTNNVISLDLESA